MMYYIIQFLFAAVLLAIVFLVGLILGTIGLSALVYPVYFTKADLPPYPDTAFVGSPNNVTFVACYKVTRVDSVTFEAKGIDLRLYTSYNVDRHIIVWFRLDPQPIKPIRPLDIINQVSLGYYPNNGEQPSEQPVSTVVKNGSAGSLHYEITANSSEPSNCAIQLFLFDDYNQFLSKNNNEALDSKCLNVTETERLFNVSFPLPHGGNYYVAVRILPGAFLSGGRVYGFIAGYNRSDLTNEECDEKDVSTCTVRIGGLTPLISNRQKCVFVELLSGSSNQNITVNENHVKVDAAGVGSIAVGVPFTILAIVCFLIVIALCCKEKCCAGEGI